MPYFSRISEQADSDSKVLLKTLNIGEINPTEIWIKVYILSVSSKIKLVVQWDDLQIAVVFY